MFEGLSEKLDRSFKILKGQGYITEINVAETLKEVRKALLDADVSYKIAKQFTEEVKTKALGQNVLTSVSPGQLMVKVVHAELTRLMGSKKVDLNEKGNPAIVLIAGLQGSGKTTFSAKLANYMKTKKGKKALLVACDVYRPAAIKQLEVLGEQIGVEVFTEIITRMTRSRLLGTGSHAHKAWGQVNPSVAQPSGKVDAESSVTVSSAQYLRASLTRFPADGFNGRSVWLAG